MKVSLPHAVIELVKGDITHQQTDAIVNAANARLAGGGGVDGAIHHAGGHAIMEELRRKFPAGCPTGDAVITGGGRLRVKFVIHAVGPIYSQPRQRDCAEQLSRAYRNAFLRAAEHGCRSVALPSISTGVYSYPASEAARIALRSARDFLMAGGPLELVRWVLFDDRTYQAFVDAAEEVFKDCPRQL